MEPVNPSDSSAVVQGAPDSAEIHTNESRQSSGPFIPLLQSDVPPIPSQDDHYVIPKDTSQNTHSIASNLPDISGAQPISVLESSAPGQSIPSEASGTRVEYAEATKAHAQTYPMLSSLNSPPQQQPASTSSHDVSLNTSLRTANHNSMPSYGTAANAAGSQQIVETITSSPGLFTPISSPFRPEFDRNDHIDLVSSPSLHNTHRQAPKETHLAEVDVDPVSGRKIINHYEIVSELGRGVHGKVKLGRNLHSGEHVAIKIVDRVSKRKRLGRTGDQETKIKREIAILKKARHPNIVGLLEVIDDPLKKKVYIVLEHAELGEVEWRTRGEPEVCFVEYRKNQRESDGVFDNEEEDRYDQHILETAHRHLERQERQEWEESQRTSHEGLESSIGPWSLEHGHESDVETSSASQGRYAPILDPLNSDGAGESMPESQHDRPRTAASQPQAPLTINPPEGPDRQPFDALSTAEVQASLQDDLDGNIFGTYETHSPHDHPSSAFGSFLSSRDEHLADRVPEHYSYVPTMSLSEIRRAIRDTMLGLEYLHYQGVVHRDIKPANLLQTRDHRVKISDFGVSYLGKATGDLAEDPSDTEDQDFDEALELAKTVGTPAFYAPELCRLDMDEQNPAPVTNQIDIWAVGVTLYCLVFGRVPFHHDNTFALMRQIAEKDVYIPSRRLKAVHAPREFHEMIQSPQALSRQTTGPSRRSPHDLVYEEVSEELRDLLKRLLIKDPRKRIKLTEVKHHPWLLTDISDPVKWLDESDPTVLTQGRPIEISQEDVDVAVASLGLSERARELANRLKRRVVDVLGYGKGASRRRAKSSAAGTGRSSNASSSSTISQDGERQEERRRSLRTDEALLSALRGSRESDHPLSRSVTASPEPDESADLFEDFAASRPDFLERGISATGSVRTIRQRDVALLGGSGAATAPAFPSTPDFLERPPNSADGMLGVVKGKEIITSHGGTSHDGHDRPLNAAALLGLDHEDTHALPSVAISQAVAAGRVQTPRSFREQDPAIHPDSTSPHPSRPSSMSGSHDVNRTEGSKDIPSRNSSVSSMSSRGRSLRSRYHPHQPHSSSSGKLGLSSSPAGRKSSHPQLDVDVIARAKEEQLRRLIQEGRQHQAEASAAPSPVSLAPCPPSPDDLDFNEHREKLFSEYAHTSPAAHTAAAHAVATSSEISALAAYDSDEQFPPAMSQSTSNPSIPSALSANSSIGNDEMAQYSGQSARRTAAWNDANAPEDRPQFRELSPHFEEGPLILGQDEYSSDEDFLEMNSKPKSRPAKKHAEISNSQQSTSLPVRNSLEIPPKEH